ncbi:helix-turn-helix transcriptional regulator [Scytonema millei VB511283]|uniref:Helix-turn-helix transcriptional regulator n=2 Tax=Scytonema TaxID=1203 RepID=A0A9X5E8I5_9CYAN|nr:helix-turn-helix transcriptional regulator [Scytonema millei VB511283]
MTKAPSLSFVVLRSLKQITQKELADVLGVTEDTISNWERGKVVPKLTIPQTKALCNLLEVNLEQLPDNFGKPERHSYQIDNGKSPPVANIDLE